MKSLVFVSLILFLLTDRLLKQLAIADIVSSSWFTLFHNEGIVFSFLPASRFFLTISILVTFWLIYQAITLKKTSIPIIFAYWLIIIGAISNIYDRIVYDSVIDYFIVFDRLFFNLADVYIIVGVMTFIYMRFKHQSVDKHVLLG